MSDEESSYDDSYSNADDDDEDELILYPLLINEISSIAFDSYPSSARHEMQTDVYELLEEEDIRLELIELGDDVVNKCNSKYAFERVLSIYMKGIILHAQSLSKNDDNKNNCTTISSLSKLCEIECKLLKRYSDVYADSKSIQKALHVISKVVRGSCSEAPLDESKGVLGNIALSLACVESSFGMQTLYSTLWKSMSDADESEECYDASASSLLSVVNESYKRREVVSIIFQKLLGGASVASAATVYLLQNYLKTVSEGEWTENNLNSLILSKMKSKPESSLETMQALFHVIAIPTSTAAILEDDILEGWATFATKQIRAMKHNVNLASLLLCALPHKTKIMSHIITSLNKKLFSQCKQRQLAYQVITNLSKHLQLQEQTTTDKEELDAMLNHFTMLVAQEEKTAGVDAESCKLSAFIALISLWKLCPPKLTGYNACIQLFASPFSLSDAKSFRMRFLTLLTEEFNEDRISLYVKHIFLVPSFKVSLLLSFVENAAKKVSATASTSTNGISILVPHLIDGVIATYLLLLHATTTTYSLSPQICKAISNSKQSFLFTACTIQILTSQDKYSIDASSILATLLPRCILLYCKYLSNHDDTTTTLQQLFTSETAKSANIVSTALAACVITHKSSLDLLPRILSYVPHAVPTLVQTLYKTVNDISLYNTLLTTSSNATRKARELFLPIEEEDTVRIKTTFKKCCFGYVRQAMQVFIQFINTQTSLPNDCYSQMAILLHIGTTITTTASKRQRNASIQYLDTFLKHCPDFITQLDCIEFILTRTTSTSDQDFVSKDIQKAVISLLSSFSIYSGDNYDPYDDEAETKQSYDITIAWNCCVATIPTILSKQLTSLNTQMKDISKQNIHMYRHDPTKLYMDENTTVTNASTTTTTKKAATKKNTGKKSGGGFNAREEEEWEEEIRKELEAKKKKQNNTTLNTSSSEQPQLSKEEVLLLEQQLKQRTLLKMLFDNFEYTCHIITSLCNSHIMVGNACISTLYPLLMESITIIHTQQACIFQYVPQLSTYAIRCLVSFVSSIYELEDGLEWNFVNTLLLIHNRSEDQKSIDIKPLVPPVPSYIPSLLQSIQNSYHAPMDKYSKQSFTLIYPILQSMLIGPHSPFSTSCEDVVLKILSDHVSVMIHDHEEEGGCTVVSQWRRDFSFLLLNFLLHDRSQAYYNTTIRILVDVYDLKRCSSSKITPGEMVSLLNEIGLLSSNPKNRYASLQALDKIIMCSTDDNVNVGVVKNDTLVENRIWINCFSTDDDESGVREEARRVWKSLRHSTNSSSSLTLEAPSKLYAFPLFPLLSHVHPVIAKSAANAFSYGMCIHMDTMESNVLKLCEKYIESCPGVITTSSNTSDPFPLLSKKIASATNTTKKKTPMASLKTKSSKKSSTKTSLLAVGMKTTSTKKKSTKSSVSASLLLPKKEERTIDSENMFALSTSQSKNKKISDEEQDNPTKQRIRQGILTTFSSFSSISTTENETIDIPVPILQILIQFLMSYGLSDINPIIRSYASDTASDLIASFGGKKESLSFLVPFLESVLATGQVNKDGTTKLLFSMQKIPKSIDASDFRKEGVVTSLGSVALHLLSTSSSSQQQDNNEYENKIMDILSMLQKSLHTPSEEVQHSSALCLSKLISKMKNKKENTVYQTRIDDLIAKTLQDSLDSSSSLAVRRGGAYGFAALIKGMGISALRKYSVVANLDEALTSSESSAATKEGALFCIELLSRNLKLLFEPYVITLLPALLQCFGDANDHVRNAANQSTSTIMSQLSAHGVKLVMPSVLSGLQGSDDVDVSASSTTTSSWRTKVACIRMLGSMSHCAPKQLASCLPKAVPKLIDSFSDTHPKVKTASFQALEELTSVVRNPEIKLISNTLLNALVDPAYGTLKALETMINTEFMHSMDAPSLALVCPILHRGLRDRAALTKRYAALIAGNICTMIAEARDFYPYQDMLLADIQCVLLDPIPDVRSTAAKAIGSLTRGLGEDKMPDLRRWLLDTLCGDLGSVERSGAAQGLAELLMASGTDMVEQVMLTELLPLLTSHHPSINTREGVLWIMTFLPSGMGQSYSSLISPSLPALIIGLSDDNDQVRDVALRAGRVLIKSHGRAHVDKILPSLESGLEDENTRIRLSSLLLLGDLLSLIGNTKVTATDSTNTQEDIRNAEKAQSHIALTLGKDTRCRILAGLFLARSDTSADVRQNALQVWKSVVSVTARTLKEILPYLIDNIVTTLGHDNIERTEVAGLCLGDIVVKLGDANVIPGVVPVLAKELRNGDVWKRRGVCIGLAHVLDSSSRDTIIKYNFTILPIVRKALCDLDPSVRRMAARPLFHNLYARIGMRALEELVPSLLVSMDTRALNGLTGILSVRSRELLPYLIPKLLSKPLTQSNIDALGSVAKVTPNTIFSFFGSIIPTLLLELASDDLIDTAMEETIRTCLQLISKHVDTDGVNILVGEVTRKTNSDKVKVRVESCWMLGVIVQERKEQADFYEQISLMYRDLLYRLNDDDKSVLLAANLTLAKIAKCVPAEELVNHLEFVKNLIASIVSDSRRRKGGVGDGEFLFPGLNIPKGLEPLLPMYQRGILYGSSSIREVAALGLSDLLSITSSKYLPPTLIIKITGPLLRIVGDRNPPPVKIAIVQTLGLILTKGGMALRAFVPQFQTTFVKSLSDPSRQVRIEAINALGLLMPLSTRLDPLIKELVSSSVGKSSGGDSEVAAAVAVQTAALEALAIVLKNGGSKAKLPESISSSMDAGLTMLFHEDDGIREAAGKVIGCSYELCKDDNESLRDKVLKETIYPNYKSSSSVMKHGICCAIYRILSSAAAAVSALTPSNKKELSSIITKLINDESALVRSAACVAIGAVIGRTSTLDEKAIIEQNILSKMTDSTEDIEIHCSLAKGLCAAVTMKNDIFPCSSGGGKTSVLDAALKLSMSSVQKVQYSFNDFLWLALNIKGGDNGDFPLLDEYIESASYENGKAMKNLATKVLARIKKVSFED